MRRILSAVIAVGMLACGNDRDDQTSALGPSSDEAPALAVNHVIQDVSRGIALAMASPVVRTQVRDAMRLSPVTAHKLDFARFLRSPGGERLRSAIALEMGMSSERLMRTIHRLPPLDFYVPAQEHRTSWTGGEDVLVAATVSTENPSLTAYDIAGAARSLVPSDGPPGRTLFLLQGAETKSRRIGAQPRRRPGLVIQDPDDGEASGTLLVVRGRDSMVLDLADLDEDLIGGPLLQMACPDGPCEGDGGGAGGGGGASTGSEGSLRLREIQTIDVCDNALCWLGDSNEFEVEAVWTNGSVQVAHTLRREGVGSTATVFINLYQLSRIPNGIIPVLITEVREDDNVGNDDFVFSSDNLLQPVDKNVVFRLWEEGQAGFKQIGTEKLGLRWSW